MTHEVDRLTKELIASVASLKAMYSDASVAPFGRARARDKVFAASDRLEAEMAKPVSVSPWTPFNQRGAE